MIGALPVVVMIPFPLELTMLFVMVLLPVAYIPVMQPVKLLFEITAGAEP